MYEGHTSCDLNVFSDLTTARCCCCRFTVIWNREINPGLLSLDFQTMTSLNGCERSANGGLQKYTGLEQQGKHHPITI